ncbi:MAG: hypothetical protein K8S87_03125 [Planctomycetes bacterium]|nr:hypothetical protein [Planctomycetota bacterium]
MTSIDNDSNANTSADSSDFNHFERDELINNFMKLDDSELFEMLNKQKNKTAYYALFIKNIDFFRNYIFKIVRNSDYTDDILQNICVKVIKNKKFSKIKSLGYFIQISKNEICGYFNKNKRELAKLNNLNSENSISMHSAEINDNLDVWLDCEIDNIINNSDYKDSIKEMDLLLNCNKNFNSFREMLIKLLNVIEIKPICFNRCGQNIFKNILEYLFSINSIDRIAFFDKYFNKTKYKELINNYYSSVNTTESALRKRLQRIKDELNNIVRRFSEDTNEI